MLSTQDIYSQKRRLKESLFERMSHVASTGRHTQIFSEKALDFSERALEESFEKVGDGTLPLGLFPSKRWKVLFFRASAGNRCHLTDGFADW